MAENRTPRELQTREKDTRAAYVYTPPSNLPSPLPQPGYEFRWIMTHLLGQQQSVHVSRQLREGWVPVKSVDHPELQIPGNKEGNVEHGGLMLCKAPSEFVDARNAHYAKQAKAQVESVDNNFLRSQDQRMPTMFSERDSKVSFGSGNR
jgi:hypothetical protein